MEDVKGLAERIIGGKDISREEAMGLSRLPLNAVFELLHHADSIRERFRGKEVFPCSLISVRTGMCSEDCCFCAQSGRYNTNINTHDLLEKGEILEKAKAAESAGAPSFCLVTSGRRLDKELDYLLDITDTLVKETSLSLHMSAGSISYEDACLIKKSGVSCYNHNLETSEGFFPNICSTHTYQDRLQNVERLKKAGLQVCCGGIFGMGETWEDRIDLAFALKALDIDVIPINFLNPIKGTPLEKEVLLEPLEALKIIAVFRFIHPKRIIKVCGGREKVLRDLQSWMFYAGANGLIFGNYLTTNGRSSMDDINMITDLGMEIIYS